MTGVALSEALLPTHDGKEIVSYGELLALRAEQHPERILLKFEDRVYSYREVAEKTNSLARGFRELGVAQGDRVCFLLPNCPEFIFAWLALARLGAVMVPVNSAFPTDTLVRMIELAGCTRIVASRAYTESVVEIGRLSSRLESVVWIDGGPSDATDGLLQGEVHLSDLEKPGGEEILAPVGPNDTLMFMFTSGSTGVSKPVQISHAFAMHTGSEVICHVGYAPSDTLFTPYPLFHADATMLSFTPALVLGTTLVLAERFSASGFLDMVRKHGITVFTAMGTVIAYLLKQPEQADDHVNTLRLAIAGAMPSTAREFEKRFGLELVEVYGSTESCLVAFNTSLPHEVGLCGRVCEHHRVRIADGDGRSLPTGEIGQILIRPETPFGSMSGYFGVDDKTVEAYQGLWYQSGDLGFLDESGVLRFAGRIKDGIRRRGENIPAAEVEEAFNAHEAVSITAATPTPSSISENDDEVKVTIELQSGAAITAAELREFAAQRLAAHMVPRYIEIVDSIPKTVTGKVDKNAIRNAGLSSATVDFAKKRESQ